MAVNLPSGSGIKTTWSEASKAKKAAMVAGAVAATAAVGATAYAAVKGKAPEDATGIGKVTGKLRDGFKQLGEAVKRVFAKKGDVTPEAGSEKTAAAAGSEAGTAAPELNTEA